MAKCTDYTKREESPCVVKSLRRLENDYFHRILVFESLKKIAIKMRPRPYDPPGSILILSRTPSSVSMEPARVSAAPQISMPVAATTQPDDLYFFPGASMIEPPSFPKARKKLEPLKDHTFDLSSSTVSSSSSSSSSFGNELEAAKSFAETVMFEIALLPIEIGASCEKENFYAKFTKFTMKLLEPLANKTHQTSPKKVSHTLPATEVKNKKMLDALELASSMTTTGDVFTDTINHSILKFSLHSNRNYSLFSIVTSKLMEKIKEMEHEKFRFFCAWHDLALPEENTSLIKQIQTKFNSGMWFVLFFYFARKYPLLAIQKDGETKTYPSLDYIYVSLRSAERSNLELHQVFRFFNDMLSTKALSREAAVVYSMNDKH